MGQSEILKLLEEHKEDIKYLSLKEICEHLDGLVNSSNIPHAIKQLMKYGEVKSIRLDVHLARKIYGKGLHRGLCLYFVD